MGASRAGGPTRSAGSRWSAHARIVRLGLGVVLLAAFGVAGCAGISDTAYDPAQACQAIGGIYRASGQCRAGLD